MGDLFVRRSTALLLSTIAVLCVALVGLLVFVFAQEPTDYDSATEANIVEGGGGSQDNVTEKLTQMEKWEEEYRIPKQTVPLHYDLYLYPNLESGSFSGRVKILVAVSRKIDFLVTHIKKLNITQTKLKSLGENTVDVELDKAFEYEPNQFWVLKPKETLLEGNYSMELEFTGSLENKIVGFYKSVYKNAAGEDKVIATSKFQPTDARAAFPCFDEPSFKSTFTVTLVRPSRGYTALSNMPPQREIMNSPREGLTEVQFKKSVPMVTYLACFIVCDFEFLQTKTQAGKPFKVYATKHQISRAQYALDIGVNILNYFEKYFEVEYPLPKQDMIAIPDFVSGAMEHWGLITYRETSLLFDDQGSSSYNKQRVASIISHELAHMWFGNLVTLSWWDDLWLNEGFASYVQYKGVAQYEQDWDMMDQSVILDLQPVLRLDAKHSSHPIVQPVHHPDQITEIFDKISYSKGASILRMLDDFMGEAAFRQGVSNFLKEYKYKNAVTSDLWRHLTATSQGLDIAAIMDTWTRQMGYPVLHVRRLGQDQVEVRQSRFLQDPSSSSSSSPSSYNYTWDVPVTYRTATVERQQDWLYRSTEALTISLPTPSSWVKFNVGQYGYYRVNYEMDMWDDLITLLKNNHELLLPSDRSGLLDDCFSMAASGALPYTVPLRLAAAYLPNERHFIPWFSAATHLRHMEHLLRTTPAYPYFMSFVSSLVEPHSQRLGWNDEGSHLERRLRSLMHSLACMVGSKDCLDTTKRLLGQWLTQSSSAATQIAPNLRDVVYEYGMKYADYPAWLIMLERYRTEVNAQEKAKLMVGLTSSQQQWIMYRFLDVSRNESIVRSQDYLRGLYYAGSNPASTAIVWDFIKSQWSYLVSRFTLNSRYLGHTVKSVVSTFTTTAQLQDAQHFFTIEPEAGAGERSRQQALEEVQLNLRWLNDYSATVTNWLRDWSDQ